MLKGQSATATTERKLNTGKEKEGQDATTNAQDGTTTDQGNMTNARNGEMKTSDAIMTRGLRCAHAKLEMAKNSHANAGPASETGTSFRTTASALTQKKEQKRIPAKRFIYMHKRHELDRQKDENNEQD